ncbi:hypothetical protein [Halobacillus litoralis]|uniref:hypothetical protein n=1 Tax=Halobacillus litoralis TaxID=45668 RepID=UPI001CD3D522|nr:hypothetical protein [Halobacillus litoralis]MCA1021547.1 hypothetical protein [Halobacillus litoralis]
MKRGDVIIYKKQSGMFYGLKEAKIVTVYNSGDVKIKDTGFLGFLYPSKIIKKSVIEGVEVTQ